MNRLRSWYLLALVAGCGGPPLGTPPSPPSTIAPPGQLLLDVSGDGGYALTVAVPSGDLSLVPLGGGAALAAGSVGPIGALPYAGRFALPFGQFSPRVTDNRRSDKEYLFVASASRPDPSVAPTPLLLGRLAGNVVTPAQPVDPAFGGQVVFAPDGSSLLFLGNARSPGSTVVDVRRADGSGVTTLAAAVVSEGMQYLPNDIAVLATYDTTGKPFIGTVDTLGAVAPLPFPFPTYGYSQPIHFQVVGPTLVVLQTDEPTDHTHLLAYPPVPWSAPPLELDTGVSSFAAAGPDTVAYTALRRESILATVPVAGGTPTVIASSGASIVYDASPDGRYLHLTGLGGGLIFDTARPGRPIATLPCSETTPPGDTCAFLASWAPDSQFVIDFGWDLGVTEAPPFPFAGYYPFDDPSSIALTTAAIGTPSLPVPSSDPWSWSAPLFPDDAHALLERSARATAAGDLYLVDLAANTSSLLAPQVLNAVLLPDGSGQVLYTQGPANAPSGIFSAKTR